MHFRSSNFKHKMKRQQIPQKLVYEKFYVHEKTLRTQNCHHKFIKNLLPEKCKENMEIKKKQFKSQMEKDGHNNSLMI